MDLRAVKAAGRHELLAYATAAADNAQGLLDDAELLAGAGRLGRAYSLAVLALEELGKAAGLLALSRMPGDLRAPQRMLEWHEVKQVGGMLMSVVSLGPPGLAVKLAGMSHAQAAQFLRTAEALAQDADRLKLRGLYVDMDRRGRLRQPSVITAAEVAGQLARARQVARWRARYAIQKGQARRSAGRGDRALAGAGSRARRSGPYSRPEGGRRRLAAGSQGVPKAHGRIRSETAAESELSCPPDTEARMADPP